MASIPLEERFWQKVDVRGPDDCWEWKAGRDAQGYGKFWLNDLGRSVHAQRVAWMLAHGELPLETMTCHTCDWPCCCDPAHLFQGTARDNHRDMCRKGRIARGDRHGRHSHPETTARGEANGVAKLTEAAVREIRREYAEGGTSFPLSGQKVGGQPHWYLESRSPQGLEAC